MLTTVSVPSSLPPADLLDALWELSPAGVVLYAPLYNAAGEVTDLHIEQVNPAAQQLLQLPAQRGATYHEVLRGPAAQQAFAFHRTAFLAGGESVRTQARFGAAGAEADCQLAARRTGDLLLVSYHVLAPAPPAPPTLAESRRTELQHLFEQAPVAITLLRGPNYVVELANAAVGLVWGRPPAQVLGRPYFEALPNTADQGFEQVFEHVRRTGQAYALTEAPVLLAREAGQPPELSYVNFVFQPIHPGVGEPATPDILAIGTEVTKQVLAHRVVEQREQEFRQMADNAPAMLWVTNPDGYCTYLNQPWYEYTGQTESEALGLGWAKAAHPADSANAATTFMSASNQQAAFSCMYRLRRHDGHYRWVVDRGQPYFSANGAYQGMVGTVIDVHEQKLAELSLQRLTAKLRTSRDQAQALNDELRSANAQLTRTNIDLDNFIYTASHDLRAPITNIEGLLTALREQLPPQVQHDAQVQPLLTMMQRSVERFQLTIEQLSDISQLQLTHTQPATSQDLAALAEDVRLDLMPLLNAAGAQFTVEVAACPTLEFAPKNLRSILYNLVSNAVKYHAPGRPPQVLLRAYRTEPAAVLEVHDNGLGLSAEQQSKLFGLFSRLHGHVEGSGIGLYMVKKIVENAGGTIAVRSEAGVGSVFTVTLPTA